MEYSTTAATGLLETSIGDLEMEPYGNHINNLAITLPRKEVTDGVIVHINKNHRSEDIEMHMSALIEPPEAVALGNYLKSLGLSMQEK